jgi:hypothetical protein
MSADRVLAAMETGPMISMAVRLTTADRRAIAEFVSGKPIGQPLVTTPPAKAMSLRHLALLKARHGRDGARTPTTRGFRAQPESMLPTCRGSK